MKIIFLTSIPLIKQHINDLYIDQVSKEYDVELWDLSKIYHRNDKMNDLVKDVKIISSLGELDEKLSGITGRALIITNILFYPLKVIYKTIKKNKIDIVTITKEGFCSQLTEQSLYSIEYNKSLMEKLKITVRRTSLLRNCYNKIRNKSVKFDYLLAADNYYPEFSKKFVKIHHIKYDEYLKNRNKEKYMENRYCLFLDSAIPNHPMYEYSSSKKIDSQKYVNLLNGFFDYIEKVFNIEVVVSAHPKSDYTTNAYNGRKIIKYQTAKLIDNSEFVLSHYSTSVINAILSQKPIIFLYYEEMLKKSSKDSAIGGMEFAKKLNAPLVNIEEITDFNLDVDQTAYNDFKYKYIVNKDKTDKTNEELIIEFLQNYENNT